MRSAKVFSAEDAEVTQTQRVLCASLASSALNLAESHKHQFGAKIAKHLLELNMWVSM